MKRCSRTCSSPDATLIIFCKKIHPVPTLTHMKTVWPILGGLGRAQLNDKRTGKRGSGGKVWTGHMSGEPASLHRQLEGLKLMAQTPEDIEDNSAILEALTKSPTKEKILAMTRNTWVFSVSARHQP